MDQNIFDFDSLIEINFNEEKLKSNLRQILDIVKSQQIKTSNLQENLSLIKSQFNSTLKTLQNKIKSKDNDINYLKINSDEAFMNNLQLRDQFKKYKELKVEETKNQQIIMADLKNQINLYNCTCQQNKTKVQNRVDLILKSNEELSNKLKKYVQQNDKEKSQMKSLLQELTNPFSFEKKVNFTDCRKRSIQGIQEEIKIKQQKQKQNLKYEFNQYVNHIQSRNSAVNNYPSNYLIAIISQRIQVLEKKLAQLQIPNNSNNRILRPTNHNNNNIFYSSYTSSPAKYQQSKNLNQNTYYPTIQPNEVIKIIQTSKVVQFCKQKCLLLTDQIKFMNKHIELIKEKQQNNQRNIAQLKKIDINHEAKFIIQQQINKLLKQSQEKLQNKLDITEFQKTNKKVQEKINLLYQNLFQKCDKNQVKNAFGFLETKIKQIILVMSQLEKQDKQALFTKQLVKCLSCDKEVEKLSTTTSDFKISKVYHGKCSQPEKMGRFGLSQNSIIRKKVRHQKQQQKRIRQIEMID